jgi:hypothetical protein
MKSMTRSSNATGGTTKETCAEKKQVNEREDHGCHELVKIL